MAELLITKIAANADDGEWYDGSIDVWNNNTTNPQFGYRDATWGYRGVFLRFHINHIPTGSTIVASHIDFKYASAGLNTVYAQISAESANSPNQPASRTDLTGRTETSNNVQWALSVTSAGIGTNQETPSLNSIIQELVNSYDYRNDYMLFYIIGVSPTSTGQYREVASLENTSYDEPELYIEFLPPPVPTRTTSYLDPHTGWDYNQPINTDFEINTNSHQADGLVFWMPFTGSSGEIDRIANTTMDRINNPVWTHYRGGATLFDGASSQRLYKLGHISVTGAPCTFTAWVYPTTGSTSQEFFSFSDQAYTSIGGLQIGSTDKALLRYKYGVFHNSTTTNSVNLNKWNFICGAFVDADYRFVILNMDESNIGTNTDNSTGENWNYKYYIGCGVVESAFFYGYSSDFRVYNRALSIAEMREIYQNPWELYRPIIPRFYSIPTTKRTRHAIGGGWSG